jgi:hypothetical protein
MRDAALNTGIATEEIAKSQVKSLCLMLDEDVVNGLERLRNTLGFPVESIISQNLRPIINFFLHFADLQEQGKLSITCIPDMQNFLEAFMIKIEVAKAQLDKNIKKLDKQKKTGLRDKR